MSSRSKTKTWSIWNRPCHWWRSIHHIHYSDIPDFKTRGHLCDYKQSLWDTSSHYYALIFFPRRTYQDCSLALRFRLSLVIWPMENSWKGDRWCSIDLAFVCAPLGLNFGSCSSRELEDWCPLRISLDPALEAKTLNKYLTPSYSLKHWDIWNPLSASKPSINQSTSLLPIPLLVVWATHAHTTRSLIVNKLETPEASTSTVRATYLSHGWSTAPSFVTNPSSAHTTEIDGVKKATVGRSLASDRDKIGTPGLTAIRYVHKWIRFICR